MKQRGFINIEDKFECEILEDVISEKTGERTIRASAVWQRADVINANRRLYPKKILANEVKRLSKQIEETGTPIAGHAYHPKDAFGETPDVSHVWESVSMDPDGVCRGILKVIPTSKGKDVIEQIRAGLKPPISSRGVGTLTRKEMKVGDKVVEYNEVNSDFKVITPGDFVMSASVEGAGIKQIMEEIESKFNETLDSKDINDKEEKMNLKDIKKEELEKENPDLVKQIQDDAVTEKETEHKTLIKEKDDAIAEKEAEITKVSEELATLTKERDDLKTENETYRTALGGIIAIGGDVITPDEPKDGEDDKTPDDKKSTDEKKALEKKVEDLNAKVTKYEADEKARTETKGKAKLQTEVNEAANVEVEKDDYKVYREFIKKDLVDEDGNWKIDEKEKVEEVIKAANKEISERAVELQKVDIVDAGLTPKGNVEDPEGKTDKAQKLKEQALYRDAQRGGFRGTIEEWRVKYEKIV